MRHKPNDAPSSGRSPPPNGQAVRARRRASASGARVSWMPRRRGPRRAPRGCGDDRDGRGGGHRAASSIAAADRVQQHVAGLRELAADDDELRVEQVHGRRDRAPDRRARVADRAARAAVARPAAAPAPAPTDRARRGCARAGRRRRPGWPPSRDSRGCRSGRSARPRRPAMCPISPATPRDAAVGRAVRISPRPTPAGELQVDHVGDAAAGAEQVLAHRARVGVVVDLDRHAEPLLELRGRVDAVPARAGCPPAWTSRWRRRRARRRPTPTPITCARRRRRPRRAPRR